MVEIDARFRPSSGHFSISRLIIQACSEEEEVLRGGKSLLNAGIFATTVPAVSFDSLQADPIVVHAAALSI